MGIGASVLKKTRSSPYLEQEGEGEENVFNFTANSLSSSSIACSPAAADGNARVSPATADEYVGVDATKIKCQVCGQVWKVFCGTSAFNCAACGVKVLVALSHVASQANTQADNHIGAAKSEVKTIMEQQAATTQELWEKLEEEVHLAMALWESSQAAADQENGAATANAVLLEATSARAAGQVSEALTLASEAGLPPPSVTMSELLVRLKDEEDLEMLWRCILHALQEEDRVDLEFWCEEAKSQELFMPQCVLNASKALSGAEKARLAELEYAAGLDAKAQTFRSARDTESLEKLIEEAGLLGADPSIVVGHLEALRNELQNGGPKYIPGAVQESPRDAGREASKGSSCDPRPSAGSSRPSAGGPPTSHEPTFGPTKSTSSASQERSAPSKDLTGMSVEELRQVSIGALKAELARYGLDPSGICEKEELIQVLLAAAASRAEASRASSAPPEQPKQESPSSEAQDLPKGLQGRWFRSNGSVMEIMGQNIVWQDGTIARIYPQGPNKFNVTVDGKAYHAMLSGDKLVWSDGDVWSQSPPPQRPRPEPGPRAGSKPKPQARAPPAPKQGPMSKSKALACLGLSGDPSEDDIKKAYKQGALRWHPDRRQNHDCADAAKEKFQEVRAAFEYLQERSKR